MPRAYDPSKRFEVANKRRSLLLRAIAYKGGKCAICGYCRSERALHFHHPNMNTKNFSISTRMTSWKAIEKELDLTVLLCSNCHAEVHDGFHPSYLIDHGDERGNQEPYGDELDADD